MAKTHVHRKNKKQKMLEILKRRLGIQGKEENILEILNKAFKRIEMVEWSNEVKEEQIILLINQGSNSDLRKQLVALTNKIEELKLENQMLKAQINGHKLQT